MKSFVDSGPLSRLILLDLVSILQELYGKVTITQCVIEELRNEASPALVRNWTNDVPTWMDLLSEGMSREHPLPRHAGERSIARIAGNGDFVITDDLDFRLECRRRGMIVTGTLGILVAGHRRGLCDGPVMITRVVAETGLYVTPNVVQAALAQLEVGK